MMLTSSYVAISQRHHCSYNTTDKNKRIMERLKWRKPLVIGPDIGPDNDVVNPFKRLSKKIWRNQNDPPSLPPSGRANIGRGTKRKASSSAGAGTSETVDPERIRNGRSRHTRCNDNLV